MVEKYKKAAQTLQWSRKGKLKYKRYHVIFSRLVKIKRKIILLAEI